jgi:hypothetical protein
MKDSTSKFNIVCIIISFFSLFLIIFIYDFYLTENFYNYNFHYKSNVLDYYSQDDRIQLFQSVFDYYFFFDLSLALLVSNYIFINIPKIIKNYKTARHLQIIWIIKIVFILTLFSIYERNTILDQNAYFFISINNFEIFDFFDVKNKYISAYSPNTFVVYFLKVLNIFFSNSWFAIKVILTLFYLITVYYGYKIINIFTKTDNILFIYILSFIPSLFYVSSIIVKDIIILPCLSIFFYYFFLLIFKKNKIGIVKYVLIIFMSIGIIALFRSWIAASCLFCMTMYFSYSSVYKLKNWIQEKRYKIFYFIVFLSIIFFILLNLYDEIIKLQSYLQHYISDSYRGYIRSGKHSTGMNLFDNIKNYEDFLFRLPVLFFYSIFNPFLEKLGELKYLILISENIIICLFLILSFVKIEKSKSNQILLIVLLSFILAFISTHMFVSYSNIGTGYRYSVQAKLPLIILFIVLNQKKIEYLFSFFNKKTKKNRIK